jgi:hypothetical protein
MPGTRSRSSTAGITVACLYAGPSALHLSTTLTERQRPPVSTPPGPARPATRMCLHPQPKVAPIGGDDHSLFGLITQPGERGRCKDWRSGRAFETS